MTQQNQFTKHLPGFVLVALIAMAAMFLSDHYGGPTLLYALLLGVSMSALAEEPRFGRALDFGAETCLPIGIALAGLGVTFTEIAALGASTVFITLAVLSATLVTGLLVGKLSGRGLSQSAIFSASVAICGGAAALAVASLFPQNDCTRRDAALAVIIVTALSTAAMILYPAIAGAFGFSDIETGIFLGATIHAVGQAVASGYSISEASGDAATLVKLMRVACLIPIVFLLSSYLRWKHKKLDTQDGPKPQLVPQFLVGFIALVVIANLMELPQTVKDAGATASQTFILVAVGAIGVQSQITAFINVGVRSLIMMTGLTLFMAALCLALLKFFG